MGLLDRFRNTSCRIKRARSPGPVLRPFDDTVRLQDGKNKDLVEGDCDDDLDGEELGQGSLSLEILLCQAVEHDKPVQSDADGGKVDGGEVDVAELVAETLLAQQVVVFEHYADNGEQWADDDVLDDGEFEQDEELRL